MRLRSRSQEIEPTALLVLPTTEPRLRDDVDPDPLVEQMVARLRGGLSDLVALDAWGRPTPWREVVRMALGPSLLSLRDGQTAAALSTALEPTASAEPSTALEPAEPVGPPTATLPQPRATGVELAVVSDLGWPAR